MRVAFRKVPIDLLVAAVVTLAILPMVLAGLGGPVRYVVALLLVFLLPGYSLVAALFPEDGEMDWIRRFALSVGLSVASVPLVGLVLDATPWGLSLGSIVASLILLSLAASTLAAWRRFQVPEPRRLSLSLDLSIPRWPEVGRVDRLLAVGVALALISGGAVVAYGLAHPAAPDRFTEFYLLDPGGGVLNYTLSLNTTDQGEVIVGVHNLEGLPINYTIVVLLVPLQTVYNATTGTNQTVEGNPTFYGSFNMDVASAATSERPYPISISVPGDFLLQFRLYLGVPQGDPYRMVDLRVTVS